MNPQNIENCRNCHCPKKAAKDKHGNNPQEPEEKSDELQEPVKSIVPDFVKMSMATPSPRSPPKSNNRSGKLVQFYYLSFFPFRGRNSEFAQCGKIKQIVKVTKPEHLTQSNDASKKALLLHNHWQQQATEHRGQ